MLRRLTPSMHAHTVVAARGVAVLAELTYPAALPKLPYAYQDGIAPVISPRQMELHFTKHHKAYVDKLNTLGQGFEGKTIEDIIHATKDDATKKVMFNQAAQHFNHTFYWKCLTPNGAAMPATLEKALTQTFGDVDKFKTAFEQSAINNFGSGWTWLCVNAKKELVIENSSNAACPMTSGLKPIFTIDVWEHAYYKDFENRRPDYLKDMWKVVNWKFVDEMYAKAMK